MPLVSGHKCRVPMVSIVGARERVLQRCGRPRAMGSIGSARERHIRKHVQVFEESLVQTNNRVISVYTSQTQSTKWHRPPAAYPRALYSGASPPAFPTEFVRRFREPRDKHVFVAVSPV